MESLPHTIKLWSPQPTEIFGDFRRAIAACLSAAFSSGIWATSPMPLGHAADRDSANGIIAEFDRTKIILVVASDVHGTRLLGCVLGGILDTNLIDAYQLGEYGAGAGDAILAYIGVLPSAQGSRVARLSGDSFSILSNSDERQLGGDSLAGLLFSRWLGLPAVRLCPRVFVRTRKQITAVLHLLERNRFECHGQFDFVFRGDSQERLVFSRKQQAIDLTEIEPQ